MAPAASTGAAAGTTAAAATPPKFNPASEPGGAIKVFEWAGYDDKNMWADYLKGPYNATSPLKFTFLENDQQALAKVASGVQYDLIHPCIAYWPDYKAAGLIQAFDPALLPDYQGIPEAIQSQVFDPAHGDLVGFTGGDPQRRDVERFLLAFDSDLAPIVGQQVTLDATNGSVVGPRIDLLLARARTPFASKVSGPNATECTLVARGVTGRRAVTFTLGMDGMFTRDDGHADLSLVGPDDEVGADLLDGRLLGGAGGLGEGAPRYLDAEPDDESQEG